MSDHAPEPWELYSPGGIPQPALVTPDGTVWMRFNSLADAQRIVACVNALAGLNPEAIPALVEALKLLKCEVELGEKSIHVITAACHVVEQFDALRAAKATP